MSQSSEPVKMSKGESGSRWNYGCQSVDLEIVRVCVCVGGAVILGYQVVLLYS